ncbi:uncharacterized protein LOC141620718 [Silene latifolia]|uniref:uncharacterized protein LOC141620718 n=1 Tax=Silene latifolia TaxID=37657 RepID=UPI003D77E0DF
MAGSKSEQQTTKKSKRKSSEGDKDSPFLEFREITNTHGRIHTTTQSTKSKAPLYGNTSADLENIRSTQKTTSMSSNTHSQLSSHISIEHFNINMLSTPIYQDNIEQQLSGNQIFITDNTSLQRHFERQNMIRDIARDLSSAYESYEANNRLRMEDDDLQDLEGYDDIGDPIFTCTKCGAQMWYGERDRMDTKPVVPSFTMCCKNGIVELPFIKKPPKLLCDLLMRKHPKSKHFIENIRSYNNMFSFTSMGGKIDHSVNRGRGPYTFRIGGENTHLIGSLLPNNDAPPKFCQLYIYDTEEELKHRKNALSSTNGIQFDDGLMKDLKQMVDRYNVLAKSFRMARDRLHQGADGEVRLRLISARNTDGRTYNLPLLSRGGGLIVGDMENTVDSRDIVVEERSGRLQRISELHASYLALQYPILFPRGEDGHRLGIPHSQHFIASSSSNENTRDKLTLREWFAFRIQDKSSAKEYPTILMGGKLFQQFVADGCTMIEFDRLKYIRFNQPKLRSENFKNLENVAAIGQTNPSSAGVRFIVPSSFKGSKGYMRETYQDTMTICRWCGYPDLFITFTCNPKWLEITRFVKKKKGLRPEDRPDILTRVFKLKLDELMRDLKERHIFGRTRAVVYTIEFQKRGLPHAHILLFLQRDDKFPEAVDVDRIISAEFQTP